MITHVYSSVALSEYKRLYLLKDEDVESKYITDDDSGRNALGEYIRSTSSILNKYEVVPEPTESSDGISSIIMSINNLINSVPKYTQWNILAFTSDQIISDASSVHAVIYNTDIYDTSRVTNIRIEVDSDLTTRISNQSTNPENTFSDSHTKTDHEFNHSLFESFISNGNSTITISDHRVDSVLGDITTAGLSSNSYEGGPRFSREFCKNKNLVEWASAHSNASYYLSGSINSMYVITKLGTSGIVTTMNSRSYSTNMTQVYDVVYPDFLGKLLMICTLEDARGLIAKTEDHLVLWIRKERSGKLGFYDPIIIPEFTDYDLLIPSFIDITGCYIKLPKVKGDIPLAYEIKYWRSLLYDTFHYTELDSNYTYAQNDFSTVPQDDIYRDTYEEPIMAGSSNSQYSYLTPIMTAHVNPRTQDTFSPISRLSDIMDSKSRTQRNSFMLELNMKMMVLSYLDLMNSNANGLKSVVCRDCGLDVVYEDGERYFITYIGGDRSSIVKLPSAAIVSNLSYLYDGHVYSMKDHSYQNINSLNIIDTKYGMILTSSQLR